MALKIAENTTAFQRIGTRYTVEQHKNCVRHKFRSDEYWRCLVGQLGAPWFHLAGSCRMGYGPRDKFAVVDSKLRWIHSRFWIPMPSFLSKCHVPFVSKGSWSNKPTSHWWLNNASNSECKYRGSNHNDWREGIRNDFRSLGIILTLLRSCDLLEKNVTFIALNSAQSENSFIDLKIFLYTNLSASLAIAKSIWLNAQCGTSISFITFFNWALVFAASLGVEKLSFQLQTVTVFAFTLERLYLGGKHLPLYRLGFSSEP